MILESKVGLHKECIAIAVRVQVQMCNNLANRWIQHCYALCILRWLWGDLRCRSYGASAYLARLYSIFSHALGGA